MKHLLSLITVAAVLLSQGLLASAKGQVVCVSSHRCETTWNGRAPAAPETRNRGEHARAAHPCAADRAPATRPCAGHTHPDAASPDAVAGGTDAERALVAAGHRERGLMRFAPEHESCEHCVHVATPDEPSLVVRRSAPCEPVAMHVHALPAPATAAFALPSMPPRLLPWRPPADPTRRAERLALESARLLI
jgi:hypothetical protein